MQTDQYTSRTLNHFLPSRLWVPRKGYGHEEAETAFPVLPSALVIPSKAMAISSAGFRDWKRDSHHWKPIASYKPFVNISLPVDLRNMWAFQEKSPFEKCTFLLLFAVKSLK